ncbi:MAG TPA: PQQ-binding-like beta-propeller repeat protein [Thermomonospora sp.]|nr:PQQ-binding-like beta-propeller repeat protein [Thermomonospora sp.]
MRARVLLAAALVVLLATVTLDVPEGRVTPLGGRLTEAWASGDAEIGTFDIDPGRGLLVATVYDSASRTRAVAVEMRSGLVRWQATRPGHALQVRDVHGDTLILDHVRGLDTVLTGHHMDTGRETWVSVVPYPAEVLAYADDAVLVSEYAPSRDGSVGSPSGYRALARATGRVLWRRDVPAGCQEFDGVGNGRVAVLRLTCADLTSIIGIRTGDGRELWRHRLGTGLGLWPRLRMTGGVFVASFDGEVAVYRDDGRPLVRLTGLDCRHPCHVARVGDLVVLDVSAKDGTALLTVNVRTGRHRLITGLPYAFIGFSQRTATDTVLYLQASPLLPLRSFLIVAIDPRDGRRAELHLPGRSLTAAHGDLLFTSGRAGFRAYRIGDGGPAWSPLGGVAPRDWPDACALLTPEALTRALPGTYDRTSQRQSLGDTRLPAPVRCEYVYRGENAPIVTVSVVWVARSSADARTHFADHPEWGYGNAQGRGGIGDEAVFVNDPLARVPTERVLLRTGRVLAEVTVIDRPGAATRVAEAVAAGLRRIGPKG